jgi:large subunit ribosomal protein L25
MSSKATLKAQKRDGFGKGAARTLRRDGRVPAVLYGRDLESLHLSVDAREAEYLFHTISVDNTIVDLAVEGEKKPYQTLVREIQTHPWKESLVHIDFLRVQEGVEVDLDVPVHLVGVPVGVRLGGGVLEQTIHDIPVRCVPSKIPEVFELDVTELNLNGSLHVSDVPLTDGVELRISPDQTICSVAVPRVTEEPQLEAAVPVEGEEGEEGAVAAEEEGAGAGERGGDED